MNIFHKITQKSLAKNRTRTLVTIIGIVLSMALFTAVIEGAYSGVQFLLRSEIEQSGSYHGYYYDVTPEQAEQLAQREDIDQTVTWQLVGWSHVDTDLEGFTPYATVVSISDSFPALVTTKVLEGRLPENDHEVTIPADLHSLIAKSYGIGDQITLSVGRRMAVDGFELGTHDGISGEIPEEIVDTVEKTYTIVGIYRPLDYTVVVNGGYVMLTRGAAGGKLNLFFTLDNIRTFYTDFAKNQPLGLPYGAHDDLLLFHGLSRHDNLMKLLYGMVVILVCLISFGSISLIYNSFAISVSERTKQFGILRSIGATKKQIRASVLYEALVLAGAGIPLGLIVGCAGIGITFLCLREDFARLINYGDTTVQIGLVLNPAALLAAAAVCLVTVLLSAWIPAKRAAKVNAIEAIRQAEDVKISGKEVKVSKLTQRLFGFAGLMASKNFKRNRKRYRSTILSLFLSVVLFISATSFCSYLTAAVTGVSSYENRADISYHTVSTDGMQEDPNEVLALLNTAEGVTNGLYMDYSATAFYTDYDNLDDSYTHRPYGDAVMEVMSDDGEPTVYGFLVFVDDDTFRALCRENHLNEKDYFDQANPLGLLYNDQIEFYQEKEGEPLTWYNSKVLDESKLPATLQQRTYREFEDYAFYAYEKAADGSTTAVYYPRDYLDEYYSRDDGTMHPDERKAVRKSAEEALIQADFKINAVVKETLFALKGDTLAVIYPYSMERLLLSDEQRDQFGQETTFRFQCENHRQTFTAMEQLLKDHGMNTYRLYDAAKDKETQKTLITVTKVFAYGFITLISLISIANVFNTISTSIALRRREFAMLKSIGLGQKGFQRMMNYECLIYGMKSLLYGLPVAAVITYLIYQVTGTAYRTAFYLPWSSVVIAVGSVFVVVFATMLYATGKIRKDNPIDALKNENL